MTFKIDDLCFIDTEARAFPDTAGTMDGNLPEAGTYRYADNAFITIFTHAIGATAPVRDTSMHDGFDKDFDFSCLPDDLRQFWLEAKKASDKGLLAGPKFVAANAGFDRRMLNCFEGGPYLKPEAWLDATAQWTASLLPPDLESASKFIGSEGKHHRGKELISIFCTPGGGTPQSHPRDWEEFVDYAIQDTEELRKVFIATRPLDMEEWRQYWAHDAINERGICFDKSLAEKMQAITEANTARINQQLVRWTNGRIDKVTQTDRIKNWIYDGCGSSEVREILTKSVKEVEDVASEEDEPTRHVETKLGLDRARIERAVAFYDRKESEGDLSEREATIRDVLQARQFGGSATPAKFGKMLRQCHGDRLKQSYVYNGAAQSGRYSSRGIQIHNLTRDVLKERLADGTLGRILEEDVLEFIGSYDGPIDNAFLDQLETFGPIARTQALLVRPTLIAPKGKTLAWCDWSAIEARMLPWLANNDGGEAILQRFRDNDADKSRPDAYMQAAAPVFNTTAEEINRLCNSKDPAEKTLGKKMRGIGKVIVLSLGFGGGVGALLAMATGYGVYFSQEEAERIVSVWREANPWARAFWTACWQAIRNALEVPGHPWEAGRLIYMYDAGYLGGSLFCVLPDGRALCYPAIKWEMKRQWNPATQLFDGEERLTLTFRKGHVRQSAWFGLFVNNGVQGTAASMQRRLHRQLHEDRRFDWMPIVMHTHDEDVVEVDEDRGEEAKETLHSLMAANEDWNLGLPVAAEADTNWFYTKALG